MKQKGNRESVEKKRKEAKYHGIYFLGCIIFLYFFLFLLEPENIQRCLKASGYVLIQIFPALLLIILLMGIMNYFTNAKTVSRYVGKGSGIKGWLLAISTGTLSHGAIYAWYPLLRDLRNQGMRAGLIAVFLYNRATKIPLLPLMVHYFGMPFVVILTAYIIMASILQGHIVQMIETRISNQT
jgi:uncharacterized membrane protein YraQ (UPF0718 family)